VTAPESGPDGAAPVPVKDPRKSQLQQRRRGPGTIVFRAAVTAAFVWWVSVVGNHPGVEFREVLVGAMTGIAGISTLAAGGAWVQAMATPLPPAAAGPPPELPPAGSAARVPLERLANHERSLAELLTLLGSEAGDVPAEVAAEAARAAATLRDCGTRLRAVEAARDGMEGDPAVSLAAAAATLRQRLEEGVSGYARLVAVAADAVSAGAAGGLDQFTIRRLEDAADTLAGLARGLRATGELT
jgi:hypothetical protein